MLCAGASRGHTSAGWPHVVDLRKTLKTLKVKHETLKVKLKVKHETLKVKHDEKKGKKAMFVE